MSKTITLNVDAGERGFADPIDHALLEYAHVLNIALGAHAGSVDTAQALAKRAADHGVSVNLHPGYSDKENFGRLKLALSWSELEASLDQQREILPEIIALKFHGALYHAANTDTTLAEKLGEWLVSRGIKSVLTSSGGALASVAHAKQIKVVSEGFADRRYVFHDGELFLKPRSEAGAMLHDVEAVREQVRLLCSGQVKDETGQLHKLAVDSVCVHGDGEQALAIAQAVREELDQCSK